MRPRLSPVERIRAQIDELFANNRDLDDALGRRRPARCLPVLQAAMEAEVNAFLGRERHARGDRDHVGYRTGPAELTVKRPGGFKRGSLIPVTWSLLTIGTGRSSAGTRRPDAGCPGCAGRHARPRR